MRIKIQPYHTSLNTKKFALKTLLSATLLGDAILPYCTDRTERQNTSLAGWVIWMQKWNGSISTSDFYRTNVFILKHSYCSKQLTSLCLNSKSQVFQKWKWILGKCPIGLNIVFCWLNIIGYWTHALALIHFGLGKWKKSLVRCWRGNLVLGVYPYIWQWRNTGWSHLTCIVCMNFILE